MKKDLKKQLAKLKKYKQNMPSLIDLSNQFGDHFFTKENLTKVNKQIQELKNQLNKDYG